MPMAMSVTNPVIHILRILAYVLLPIGSIELASFLIAEFVGPGVPGLYDTLLGLIWSFCLFLVPLLIILCFHPNGGNNRRSFDVSFLPVNWERFQTYRPFSRDFILAAALILVGLVPFVFVFIILAAIS